MKKFTLQASVIINYFLTINAQFFLASNYEKIFLIEKLKKMHIKHQYEPGGFFIKACIENFSTQIIAANSTCDPSLETSPRVLRCVLSMESLVNVLEIYPNTILDEARDYFVEESKNDTCQLYVAIIQTLETVLEASATAPELTDG